MKYRFVVQKFDEEKVDNDPFSNKTFRGFDQGQDVFSVEIGDDEMVELMEHL